MPIVETAVFAEMVVKLAFNKTAGFAEMVVKLAFNKTAIITNINAFFSIFIVIFSLNLFFVIIRDKLIDKFI